MNNKLLLTKWKDLVLTARKCGDEIVDLNFETMSSKTIIGNIYVARVENVVKNINAAFVSYAKGEVAYLPFDEASAGKLSGDREQPVHQGDLLLVQIVNEAIKTKPPKATSYVNFTGRYSVITFGKTGLGISSKITDAGLRTEYKEKFEKYLTDEYGIIIRTNASEACIEAIEKEIAELTGQLENIRKLAATRSAHTLMLEEEKAYIKELRSVNFNEMTQIETDDDTIYKEVLEYINTYEKSVAEKLIKVDEGEVIRVHSLESVIKQALSQRVWLKCGGYLVIQPTEALTVIDVNSGKCVLKKKSVAETVKKVNAEACQMIAKQLRLRNLSGIILVDFIDMQEEADRKEVLKYLKECVEADPVKTVVVDMTKLNLVEITRKKIRKPVYEQVSSYF